MHRASPTDTAPADHSSHLTHTHLDRNRLHLYQTMDSMKDLAEKLPGEGEITEEEIKVCAAAFWNKRQANLNLVHTLRRALQHRTAVHLQGSRLSLALYRKRLACRGLWPLWLLGSEHAQGSSGPHFARSLSSPFQYIPWDCQLFTISSRSTGVFFF